jgi:hypothetical protein
LADDTDDKQLTLTPRTTETRHNGEQIRIHAGAKGIEVSVLPDERAQRGDEVCETALISHPRPAETMAHGIWLLRTTKESGFDNAQDLPHSDISYDEEAQPAHADHASRSERHRAQGLRKIRYVCFGGWDMMHWCQPGPGAIWQICATRPGGIGLEEMAC